MKNFEEYYEKYPMQKMTLDNGKEFVYRYYKNNLSDKSLVLLTGGIGLSDLLYLHFDYFAKDFSVITFDYQLSYDNTKEFTDAVAKVLRKLNTKAWLVGQSLGGIIAQIIAREHSDVVDGLVLSNTCSLSKDMNKEAYDQLLDMIKRQAKSKKMLKLIPFGLYKKMIVKAVMKKVSAFSEEEKATMKGICDTLMKILTKDYEIHMINFLADTVNHYGMRKEDFQIWNNKVLLLLSEDDHTFNQSNKDALIEIMPNPKVVTDITGGHLALLIRLEKYAEVVKSFIQSL